MCVRVCMAVNDIGDKGAASLGEALKRCSELRELDLGGELLGRLSVQEDGV